MSDLMLEGARALADAIPDLGRPVIYRRDAEEVATVAIPGQTAFRTSDARGMSLIERSSDFIFRASDLVFAGGPVVPDRGDQVDFAGRRYRVSAPPGEDVWRWGDAGTRQILRVHTTEQGPAT